MAEERRVPTVLVVDDEPVIVRLLHRLLETEFVVTDAFDGPSGIQAWRASPVDVIVLDHMMPGLDGLEVAAQILAEDPTQRIVMFTALTNPSLVARAEAVGIRAFVPKTDAVRLAEVLTQVLAED